MSSDSEEEYLRWGIPAARSLLWVARLSAERYSIEQKRDEPNKHALMLYFGSFFVFARSSLQALQKSDSQRSENLSSVQESYFRNNIQNDPIYSLLKNERDKVAHGHDDWAAHPMMPLPMITRYEKAGYDWSVAVFDEVWPDGVFQGQKMEEVMNKVWRQVANWLDEIDALDSAC